MLTTSTHRPAERGSVLIVSLMLLLVLTILGITAMGNMTMEERMAAGYQKLQQAIDGGSSATNRLIAASVDNYRINDGVNDPLNAGINGLQLGINKAQDRGTVNLDSTTSAAMRVAYLGDAVAPKLMPGNDTNSYVMVFDVRADTAVQVGGVTSAQSIQVQTVQYTVPNGSESYVEPTYVAKTTPHLPFKDN